MIKDPSRHSDLTPQEGRTVKISEASRILQVHKDTLRRWEKNGKITPVRTPGGTRLYSLDELRGLNLSVVDDISKPPPSEEVKTSSEDLSAELTTKPRSVVPEFLVGSTAIFVLLVSIGVVNIKISMAKNSPALPSPAAVLAEVKEVKPETSPTTKPTSEATPEAKPKKTVTVKIEDGASSVNIRQKPTTNSEKIGKASDGDIFEFVAIDSGWYEITLPDGATGFISEKYAVMEESEN